MQVERQSQFSQKVNTMELDVTLEQLERYEQGQELVQNIFPNLNADEREFLITGATPEEWKEMFG